MDRTVFMSEIPRYSSPIDHKASCETSTCSNEEFQLSTSSSMRLAAQGLTRTGQYDTDMRKFPLHIAAALTTLSTALYSSLLAAQPLDPQLACNTSAHMFITGLVNDDFIAPGPTHVEANSVNAFRPKQGSGLTAFGFPVHSVFGYDHNDALFIPGNGDALAGSIYGVVVAAPADQVEARVQESGSDAVVREVVPLVATAIFCKR